MECNSNNPAPSQDKMEVAVPYQEREDNPEKINCPEEAEPSVTNHLSPTPKKNRVEEFGDFVIGGDLDQSFAGSQPSNMQLYQVSMAQRQLDQPPLDLQDMWYLSDDEERKDKRLPGEGLDISCSDDSNKKDNNRSIL